MPKLYYVDDQGDYLASLQAAISHADRANTLGLEKYVGVDRAVETFMKAILQSQRDAKDAFLLDINMPPPNLLKLARVWPDGHAGSDQYCGIALARWLVGKKLATSGQIALLTHWVDLRPEHEVVAGEVVAGLRFAITDDNYLSKNDTILLQKWLTGKC